MTASPVPPAGISGDLTLTDESGAARERCAAAASTSPPMATRRDCRRPGLLAAVPVAEGCGGRRLRAAEVNRPAFAAPCPARPGAVRHRPAVCRKTAGRAALQPCWQPGEETHGQPVRRPPARRERRDALNPAILLVPLVAFDEGPGRHGRARRQLPRPHHRRTESPAAARRQSKPRLRRPAHARAAQAARSTPPAGSLTERRALRADGVQLRGLPLPASGMWA